MRVLVQWANAQARDWDEIDSSQWAGLPDKGVPTTSSRVDGRDGWVHAVNVQGVVFSADHYAVVEDGDTVVVYAWNDDPDDWEPGEYVAHVVRFEPLAPDAYFGGAYNTHQTHDVYTDSASVAAAFGARVQPWAAFAPPPEAVTRHGVWLADNDNAAHRSLRSTRGWREWTEGVPDEEIVNGRVREQRAIGRYNIPDGTKTFYHNATDRSIPAYSADNENALELTPVGGPASEPVSGINGIGKFGYGTATPASEPNNAAWPAGTYRAQLDVVSADSDIAYGLLLVGGATGSFYRYDSALVLVLESKQQVEAAFTLSGLKLATTGATTWLAGSSTDRYGFSIACARVTGHGNKSMTMELGETDDFTDGPWPSGVTVRNAPFFGAHW